MQCACLNGLWSLKLLAWGLWPRFSISRKGMLASPSPSISEGMLQELRRARTYVAFIQTDSQAGTFSLFFCHCANGVVVVVEMVQWFVVDLQEVRDWDYFRLRLRFVGHVNERRA